MIRLLMLGGLSLTNEEGGEIDAVLGGPKRLALLCVLGASPGWVARDRLVALLWPDKDEAHARQALRQTLSEVKAGLPSNAIAAESGAGLRRNPDHFSCDAAELYEAAAAGDHSRVRRLYRGEFLPGFHVAVPSRSFEDWVQSHRDVLCSHAFRSTWVLALSAEKQGQTLEACQLAVEAARLQPYDEAVLRQAVRLLTRQGDRARSLALFEAFRARLRADLEIEPSRATLALMEAVRGGNPLPE